MSLSVPRSLGQAARLYTERPRQHFPTTYKMGVTVIMTMTKMMMTIVTILWDGHGGPFNSSKAF